MSTLSYAALEKLWDQAGGNPAAAPVAAAIAEAESSGNTAAESPNPDGGTNVGPWQLDTPGGKGAGYTIAQLLNPATNAKAAVAGSNDGTDWSAWQTYVQGTYKKYLNGAGAGAGLSGSTGSGSSGSGSGGSGFVWFEPWTWGNALTSGVGSVEQFGLHYAAVGLAVITGLALVGLGIKRATGVRSPVAVIQEKAEQAAPLAAAAA